MSQSSFEQKIEIVSKMALDYCNENGLKFKQYNQKLAELVVRECAGIDFRHKVGMTIDQDFDTSRAILEHFGLQ